MLDNLFKYTEKKLAKEIADAAKSIDPSFVMTYKQDTNEVLLMIEGEEKPYVFFLGNVFLKFSTLKKKERLASIETYVSDALQPRELTPDQFMNTLALRARTQYEVGMREKQLKQMGHEVSPSVKFRHGDLLVEVVSDGEESLSMPSVETLTDYGVTIEESIEIASATLRRNTGNDQWVLIGDSIWASNYNDDYDFVRMIAAKPYSSFPFKEEPIVYAPSHSVCLTTNSEKPEVLSNMIKIGDERAENHRPFSQLLWYFDDGFVQWENDSAGVCDIIKLQKLKEASHQYQETKALIERSLKEDIFVAKFQAIQGENGLFSYCVYTLDLPSYLPRTEYIAIIDSSLSEEQSIVGWLDWNDFQNSIVSTNIETIKDTVPLWHQVLNPLNEKEKNKLRQLARPSV